MTGSPRASRLTAAERVTVVVTAWQSAGVLEACLAALPAGAAVVVVDNASTDDSAAIAERLGARVVRNARNEGFGRGMNRGAAEASTEFLLLLNPDAVLEPGALDALVAAADARPDVFAFGPRLVEQDGRVFFKRWSLLARNAGPEPKGREPAPTGDTETPFLSGAAFFVRRAAFEAVGGFDPEIFLFYEDDDLCRRLTDAGGALLYVHAAGVRHARGGSSAPAAGRTFRARWHLAWSRGYVARKWGLADPSRAVVARNVPKAALARLSGNAERWERYAGSAAGAWAWLRGRRAIEREGLAG